MVPWYIQQQLTDLNWIITLNIIILYIIYNWIHIYHILIYLATMLNVCFIAFNIFIALLIWTI